MTNSTQEIWFTTTKKGQRQAWTMGHNLGNARRLSLVDAELMILTGAAVECGKPAWVGAR